MGGLCLITNITKKVMEHNTNTFRCSVKTALLLKLNHDLAHFSALLIKLPVVDKTSKAIHRVTKATVVV